MPAPLLQQASLFVAQGFRHEAFAPCPLLSVKCLFNGSALYRADRAWFSVNEGHGLLSCQPAQDGRTSLPMFMKPIQIPSNGGKKINVLGIPMVISIHGHD